MNNQETTMPGSGISEPDRIVEFEFRMPRRQDLNLPKLDVEPVRQMAEQVILTGLGLSVLASRAVAKAIQEASKAGAEAAEQPGPVTRTLLNLVGSREHKDNTDASGSIRVLPISDYASLDSTEIISRLPELNRDQLESLRDYEMDHQRRKMVLEAIDGQLTTAV